MSQGWARVIAIPGLLLGLVGLWILWPSGPRLTIVEIDGHASLSRANAATVLEAREGTPLQSSDHVTTAADSRAVLSFGPHTQIRVGPASSVEVASVDDQGVSLELEDGSVRAIVRPDSGEVRVGNRGRGIRATDGTVDVGVRDDVLQIRAIEGDVALEGLDRDTLREGEAATVTDRRMRVDDVPSSLLLSVQPATRERTARASEVVRGQTAPAAEVLLRGPIDTYRVRADAEGQFSADVGLAEGENDVIVEATDLFGQRATVKGTLPVRDTTGPAVRSQVEYP